MSTLVKLVKPGPKPVDTVTPGIGGGAERTTWQWDPVAEKWRPIVKPIPAKPPAPRPTVPAPAPPPRVTAPTPIPMPPNPTVRPDWLTYQELLAMEKAYQARLRQWLAQGGTVFNFPG